ncbi:aldo/keto reductase [Streptosporangium sp. NPDC001559]|uniref:aldo/keto reductase n=1 Tax=Streptosporangium sp. NPDC001559 TaxID=3366187 RepID=UPI0036EBBB4F
MDYVRLGSTGMKVSRICLGMMSYGDPSRWREWILDEERAEPIVRHAAEAGVTFYDTADGYSGGRSEEITGNLLRAIFPNRDDYILATKVFLPVGEGVNDRGLSRKHVFSAIDGSLRRLGVDHVDLYQIHRWDPETPIEETMRALHDVVTSGKALYIGASSMSAWQFAKAQHVAETNGWTKFVAMQNHYNLIYREDEREMIPLCADQGVGLIPWSPLARGLLARAGSEPGSVREESDATRIGALYSDVENNRQILDRVAQVAAERGVPAAQVALSWVLRQPGVSAPIVGATKTGHVDDAVSAIDLALTDKEIAFLAEPYRPRVAIH